jgi:very-short-patch-repair endonuclease
MPDTSAPVETTTSDFFQGDVESGLEKMRARLLDLTGRNRLLNYRFTKRSSLRVIDEVPDQVFECLSEGRDLTFVGIPRPRRPISAYPEELDLDLEGGETKNDDDPNRLPTIHEQARILGIDPSYELPRVIAGSAELEAKHRDRKLQTFHFPEDLEKSLRSLSNAARLTIEETGTNMLYLAFGHLEWYESEASSQPRLAPLILCPVSLERGSPDPETHVYRYTLRHSGEDTVANITLQELMRRDFFLGIPEIDEEETPEKYFRRVERIVEGHARWKVRRHLTLTLLSFGKVLMYRDLDPSTWPEGEGPDTHPRIREFFEGIDREPGGPAPEYPLDDPALGLRVPPIVDDADSSQHSALVDAIAGKNLVIQGPPGTGKSQTITNLIAAAMADGKTVLFVSEKLAALEVVRHRLNKAGLGTFCLELHSHKTQKRALLDDLVSRLELRGSFEDPYTLDGKLQSLVRERERLTRYADLINTTFGRIGQTAQEVLWWCRRSRSAAGDVTLLDPLSLRDVAEWTISDIEERRQVAREYSVNLGAVFSGGRSLMEHPWRGITNARLTYVHEGEIAERLERIVAALDELGGWREAAAEVTDMEMPATQEGIQDLAAAVERLPLEMRGAIPELLPRLSEAGAFEVLRSFGRRLEEAASLRGEIQQAVPNVPQWTGAQASTLSAAATAASADLPAIRVVGEMEGELARLTGIGSTVATAIDAANSIIKWLDCELPITAEILPLLVRTLEAAHTCPLELLHRRTKALEGEHILSTLSEAGRVAAPIRVAREDLSSRLHLNLAPPQAETRHHAVTVANASWWSILDRRFREARRAYRAMSISAEKPKRSAMAADFHALLAFQEQLRSFENDGLWRSATGEQFSGIDTPFEQLMQLAQWRAELRRLLQFDGEGGKVLAAALWNVAPDRLRNLLDANSDSRLRNALQNGLEAVERSATRLNVRDQAAGPEELSAWVGRLDGLLTEHRASSETLRAIGLRDQVLLTAVPHLVEQVGRFHALREEIVTDRDAAQLLGGHFGGLETDFDRVLETFQLHRIITSAGLPTGLQSWILSASPPDRLKRLHGIRFEADNIISRLDSAWESFRSLTELQDRLWLGAEHSIEAAPLAQVASRSREALESRGELTHWLQFIQARAVATSLGLDPILQLAEASRIAADKVPGAFEFALSNSMVKRIFRDQPDLAQFNALTHDEVRKTFAKLDEETIRLTRARIAARVDLRLPPPGNGGGRARDRTDLFLIETEISKQRRHIPIRQLVLRAGGALQALKPCFMMGPLSVAQYLDPSTHRFDLVVMDEASQLKPEDALGAICRGTQVVIVGDPMQLPPTNFFDRLGEEEEDDDEALAMSEAESILDVASSVYRPLRMLKWHYRSRHGELIAFSNKEFYDNKLVVFPSPVAKSPEFGIKFVHVPDGVYHGRRNIVEARRLLDAAFRHMQNHPDESLGIVTLNSVQREFLENELEQRLKTDVFARRFLERHEQTLEPLFVKNLENVQGDERDVIFISVTYGPNNSGQVFQRFGPINGVAGHRRLNVLFTRARKRVGLFSSLLSEQIRVEPNSAQGLVALKNYLAFAADGILDQARYTGREPDSDFEVEVAEALRKRGCEVVAQVGVSNYFIDLAVKHPYKRDAFLLGIECDGATYHRSRSARDRDRLRQAVLESLGWKIERIWSADWFKDPLRQVDRIAARIDQLLAAEPPRVEEPEELATTFEIEEVGSSELRVRPRYTVEEARAKLVELREGEFSKTYPGVRRSSHILRDEMIEVLLRHRPVDRSEWMERIPFDLRVDTDGRQLAHLDLVLEVVGAVVDS